MDAHADGVGFYSDMHVGCLAIPVERRRSEVHVFFLCVIFYLLFNRNIECSKPLTYIKYENEDDP